ncbi:MAG: M20/M25/M40 family metallo-hydrolase [Oscillospiraceae bacterium]|nr:M20/M25/M40 family metallo-hydrolase [Oscillospiraceae bacterium]
MVITDIKETLFKLSRAAGATGYEGGAAAVAAELLTPLCDEVKIDRLGSVTGFIRPRKPLGDKPLRVLLDAHLDEVGIMVTGEKDGFFTFCQLGGIDPRILPDMEFTLLTEPPVKAVVACLPPHLVKPEETGKAKAIEDLYLDTGGLPAPVGTVGVFRKDPGALGSNLCGKSFDDRACFVTLLRALEHLERDKLNAEVVVCGSVQEEIGGNGALTVGYGLHPDYAIAVDVTFGTTPDSPVGWAYKLGGGVCVNLGPDCNRGLNRTLIELAKAKDIPYQLEVSSGMSGTNATEFQIARDGVATAVLSVPLRYMHTPCEVLNTEDIEACAKLIGLWVNSL